MTQMDSEKILQELTEKTEGETGEGFTEGKEGNEGGQGRSKMLLVADNVSFPFPLSRGATPAL